MTQSVYIGIHVAVAAGSTGMGRITLFGTGGLRHNKFVAVTNGLDGASLIIIAESAIPALGTSLGTSCFRDGSPFAHIVTQSIHISVHIAVAANRTSMGHEALRRTRGRSHDMFVAVTSSFNRADLVVITARAIPALGTTLGTGCFRDDSPFAHGMAQGIHISVRIAVTTVSAGMGGIALLHTGGCGHNRFVAVTSCRNNFRLVVAASVAVPTILTIFHTGCGTVDEPFSEAVAGSLDDTSLVMIAVGAIPTLGTIFGTGCFRDSSPITHIVAQGRNNLMSGQHFIADIAICT